jgi:hypothetical protein
VGDAAGFVVVVAVAVESVAPVKPVADVFACTDGDAMKPVVVFPFVASGAAVAALRATSTAVGSVGVSCVLAAVPSATAWPPILVAATPTVIAADTVAPAPFAGTGGGAKAAAVEELAAMAAAAIASGAVELAAGVGAALAVAACGTTGMAVATAITAVTGVVVALASVVLVASVVGVESPEVLSLDLLSLGFAVADFALLAGVPPDFPPAGLVGGGCPESAGESFDAPERVA